MRIPNGKIWKMVGRHYTGKREILGHVYFNADDGHLVASDGYGLAIVPVEHVGENETAGLIHPDAIKMASKHSGELIAADDQVVVFGTGWSVDRANTNKEYPDYKSNVLDLVETDANKAVPVLTLSAERLYRLAQAICQSSPELKVKLYLPLTTDAPIEVRPANSSNKARGILMPLKRKDDEELDLRPLVRALEGGGEIDDEMRGQLKRLLGVS